MYFTSGDHGSDASVKVAVNPAELILTGRPITADGMNVAVDESGRERRAFCVDGDGGSGSVDIFLFTYGSDAIADRDHGVSVEDGIGEVAAEQESDIADY